MADASEAEERRLAELEFVTAAYPGDEAWVERPSRVNRRLLLPDGNNAGGSCCTEVVLALRMPDGYPEHAALGVDAFVGLASSSAAASRKRVLNALPSLVGACRSVAAEQAGSEAVFAVLGRADEWVADDWEKLLEEELSAVARCGDAAPKGDVDLRKAQGLVLGRRLIHSHHIIAPTKRKAIVDLAKHYNLGGYFKVGWPGVIIVEGAEDDCLSYVDDIRGMRWQHLVVRGEQQIPVKDRMSLEEARVLPGEMQEVGDRMSTLAEVCRRAGLEELFLTSMKIYSRDEGDNSDQAKVDKKDLSDSFWRYGALIHVDHMNDGRNYRKWLRRAAAVAGCTLVLKQCHANDDEKNRPIILVGAVGEKDDVRRFLKRWRTSRVDVDSSGQPCLERMMTVIAEGNLDAQNESCYGPGDDIAGEVEYHIDRLHEEDMITVNKKCLDGILSAVGGPAWVDAFHTIAAIR